MFKRLFKAFGSSNTVAEADTLLEPQQGKPLIRLRGVSKVFGSGEIQTLALKEMDLDIQPGEFVTVAGPSGCGKSTLLHIMGLLESPSSGTYELNGRPVSGFSPSQLAYLRNKCVGFIFQNFNLIGDLTVFENVEIPLTYIRMPTAERRERVEEALRRVDMWPFARRYPSQITGGQQQRVAVARAVVGDPQILMADEPTGNLDSSNGEAVMQLLQELHQKGSTLFLVTHNPDYAVRAERTIPLFDGKIDGEKEAVV